MLPVMGLTAIIGVAYTVQTAMHYSPSERPERYVLSALTVVVLAAALKVRNYCNNLKKEHEAHPEIERFVPEGLNAKIRF